MSAPRGTPPRPGRTSQYPFASGVEPRYTCPSAQRGVGSAGGSETGWPLPPRPFSCGKAGAASNARIARTASPGCPGAKAHKLLHSGARLKPCPDTRECGLPGDPAAIFMRLPCRQLLARGGNQGRCLHRAYPIIAWVLGHGCAFDRNLVADFHGVLLPAAPDQRVGRTKLKSHVAGRAALVFEVEKDVSVRILPGDLRDDSRDRSGPATVVLGIK